MRENPPGLREWSAEYLAAKNTFNLTKLEALTVLKKYYQDGVSFGSEDLATEMGITRRYAAMILSRLRKAGVIRITDGSTMQGQKGRNAIVYMGTPELIIKLNHVSHMVRHPPKQSAGRTIPRIEV